MSFVFVSHASENRAAAEPVIAALRAEGLALWIAPDSIEAGKDFDEAIVDAIGACAAVVVLISAAANSSKHVKREVSLADRARKRIFPVTIEAVEPAAGLAYYLQTPQWARFHERGAAALKGMGALIVAPAAPGGVRPAVPEAQRREAEETRRRAPGAEFRDGEGLPLMVTIPPGSFRMGSPDTEKDRYSNEGPVREVRIGYSPAVGKFPVTVGEWRKFIEATGHDTGASARVWDGKDWKDTPGRGWASPGFAQDDRHPVTCTNWNDAQAYVAWISKLTGQRYRLLSEAEWEYACRAGSKTRYAFGDEINAAQANFGRDKAGTTPAGAYPANGFGLGDTHGNVWEWVQDCYKHSYAGQPIDGSAYETNNCSLRVFRGGSWYNYPRLLRSATRDGFSPTFRINVLGFRVSRTL